MSVPENSPVLECSDLPLVDLISAVMKVFDEKLVFRDLPALVEGFFGPYHSHSLSTEVNKV